MPKYGCSKSRICLCLWALPPDVLFSFSGRLFYRIIVATPSLAIPATRKMQSQQLQQSKNPRADSFWTDTFPFLWSGYGLFCLVRPKLCAQPWILEQGELLEPRGPSKWQRGGSSAENQGSLTKIKGQILGRYSLFTVDPYNLSLGIIPQQLLN